MVECLTLDRVGAGLSVTEGIALSVDLIMPNKNISVFRVTGLKILGRVGTHFFLLEKI